MTNIKIINVSMCNAKTEAGNRRSRRTYLWECDNGAFYLTRGMAKIIGTLPEALVYKYRRYGVCDKLIVPSDGYKGVAASDVEPFLVIGSLAVKLTCRPGDIVIHKGKNVSVNKIIEDGKESTKKAGVLHKGVRSIISACRITPDTGAILKRSSFYVGDKWSNI